MNKKNSLGLEEKDITAEVLAQGVMEHPDRLPELLRGISSENARLRFKSAKILTLVSEKNPSQLYPHLDFFITLLESDNNIIKWNAQDIIANLTSVDGELKFDQIFEKYYGALSVRSLITAAHVVENSAKIVKQNQV